MSWPRLDCRLDARKHVPPKKVFVDFFDLSDVVLRLWFLNPSERSRDGCRRAEQNEKLSEQSEFLSFPLTCARRGNPQGAKRSGVFSWARFFETSKNFLVVL